MSSDNLGEIVKAIRSELGYEVYYDGGFLAEVRGEIYWLFRNVVKRQIIPIADERFIIIAAAIATKTADNINIELLREDYSLIQILPHAVENFPVVFRDGMQAYLEQRHYVTKPQQALDHMVEPMLKSLNPSSNQ